MNFISLDTFLDHLDRYRARQRVRRCGVLVLQTLVNLEEMRDLVTVMRRQLVDIVIIVPVRILERMAMILSSISSSSIMRITPIG